MTKPTTRLAPSPTGALHPGNARTFLINWAMARQAEWRVLMRIEDLDGPRVKPGAIEETLDIMAWLGLDYDGPVLVQSEDPRPYEIAATRLADQRLAYQCDLTRAEILSSLSAPHAGEGEVRYPPDWRPDDPERWRFAPDGCNLRFACPDEAIQLDDLFSGRTSIRPIDEIGDFVIWSKRGEPAYQLAVVVDDARQGVTHVVRGDDLLPSAGRQMLLYRALDLTPPIWCHLPLVVGPDGRRLAKRHGDSRIAGYREAGVAPERLIGLIAFWCGLTRTRQTCSLQGFRDGFTLDDLPRETVTMTQEDHQWLCGRRSS